MPASPTITDADLLRLPRDGRKRELVDGEIRVSPAGGRHGQLCVEEFLRLSENDCLDGEDVLPGFACVLADIFG